MNLLAHSYYLRYDAKQLARMRPYPPLSTLLAAAVLRERGHEVALFDAMLASGVEEFDASLDAHAPRVVAIVEDSFNFLTKMCTLRMRDAALYMVAAARERGCRVVVSGSDATDQPALYLDAGADAILLGDAEAGLAEVVAAWSRDPGAGLADVAGLALRGPAGRVVRTAARPSLRDLDALPLPAWDLVDVGAYRSAWLGAHGRFSWNAVSSRGCPFGCNWCAKPIFGRRYAQRSPASMAEEMRRLKEAVGPDHLWFADDIFGLTADWVERFSAEVTKRDARIPFMIQSRADLLREPAVAALAAAGVEEVWMGVESGSQRILDAMDKGTHLSEIREATRVLKAHGVRACWFIQLGYPTETWHDLLLTRDLIRSERPDEIGVSVAYPLPGTKFYHAVRAQLGAKRNWDDTDDLAMLFQGTYTTPFYRRIRDVLHHEVTEGGGSEREWLELLRDEPAHRSPEPTIAAMVGSA
ncbi:MAG TPA: radical SAM protein [Longimicrobiales bacterium]|nr:radical SAM protein [Longimicrobiales bacterium]